MAFQQITLEFKQRKQNYTILGSSGRQTIAFDRPTDARSLKNTASHGVEKINLVAMKIIMNGIALIFLSGIIPFLSSCNPNPEKKKTETGMQVLEVEPKKTILFFGNSLTAGYGIDPEESFAGRIQSRLDSLEKEFRVINGGLSGETTAGGLSRLDWFLEEEPYLFILELGGNDGLRGIPLTETKKNLLAIVTKVQAKYPNTKVILAGMQIPPNMGQEYTEEFKAIYPAVASEKNIELIPFLLEGVAGNPDLNLPDGIHPTAEGHRLVMETLWPYISTAL